MPAIDRNRLIRELEGLVNYTEDPPTFRWELLNFLEFYADRTRRPGTKRLSDDTARLGVPSSVMQLVVVTITRLIPDPHRELVSVLWAAGVREARMLAISLAAIDTPEEVKTQFDGWVRESEDPVVLQELAAKGYAHWLSTGKVKTDSGLSNWLAGKSAKLQWFGLEVLRRAVLDPTYDSLPVIFQRLNDLQLIDRSRNRKALLAVFHALIEKNPSETAGYLLKNNQLSSMRWLVHGLDPLFPAHERQRIRQILSS